MLAIPMHCLSDMHAAPLWYEVDAESTLGWRIPSVSSFAKAIEMSGHAKIKNRYVCTGGIRY